jgi:23S rRNA (guanosine2251-2'-O)-methyltransferase
MDNRICGVHAVFEAIASKGQPIERIHIARGVHSSKVNQILDLARDRGIPIRREERSVLDRLARGEIHQGVVAVAGEAEYASFERLFGSERPLVVVLDGIEDPHNLGAVIRTAEACGVSGIVVPERHSAPLSTAVAKASAGASAYVPVVRVTNIVAALDQLKERGLWVVGVDMAGAQEWTGFDYTAPVALVFGGEHRGIRRLVREHCDALVRIPMLGKIASLNISVAAGVVLYEVVRQRTARN